MKKIFTLLLAVTFISTMAQAQGRHRRDESLRGRRRPNRESSCPRVYLGFGTGINSSTGYIGPSIDISIIDQLSIGAGVGLSTWGTKAYGELRYYFSPCNRGWALGAAITHSSGLDYTTFSDVETKYYGNQDVDIKLDPMTNLALSGYRFFNLGHRSNRFFIQAGYSVPLTDVKYHVRQGIELSDTEDKAFHLIAPGGLILAVGFSFGLGV